LFANKQSLVVDRCAVFLCWRASWTWSYFIPYVQQFTGRNEKIGGYLLTGTLVMFGLGRFTLAAIMKHAKPAPMMGIIADKSLNFALSYSVPLVGYVVIAGYSFFGQRLQVKSQNQ
jgi:FHS family L-fucose permease-like MFS transporter